ncbi:glycosyltransferase [Cyanobium sp. Candia 9D4]|uniref:glycosyltransferase family 2 protein n=1 Tax=Cyanobium sp. Candia 9D4 TaxID=2823707 RepID=UPI0020CE9D5D|nr:glycosyltransferase family 2 protein [Cyanobium sp. Candia 9D4]MCP9934478.1 glycosyltransferase [Cyanobium sp. Candia 9D4]
MSSFRLVGEAAEVAVIVVTYCSAHDLPALIESLRAEAEHTALRLIVADNRSSDATLELARAYPDVVAVDTGGNLGYSAGINRAMAYAGDCPAVLVLNPDLVVQPGCIVALLKRLDGDVGAVVPVIRDGRGKLAHSLRNEPGLVRALSDAVLGRFWRTRPPWLSEFIRDDRAYCRAQRIDWATGAALMVARPAWDAVGQWDERFFLYSEETDFFRRVRAAGFSVWFEPGAEVTHRGGGSGSSPQLNTLLIVNKVNYFRKHRPLSVELYRLFLILGEELRRGGSSHELARSTLRRRRLPADIPCAEYAPVPAEEFPSASIIIPAHNEGAVIDRTLAALDPLVAAGTAEVIVVPNGCTDDTAERARAHAGVRVVELAEGSKTAALNAGDAHASRWPRLYLDADIEAPAEALAQAVRALAGDGILAARPAFRWDLQGAEPVVIAYYRARGRMPSMSGSMWGAGVYGLSEAGHRILGKFPRVIADDLLVERSFPPGRKYVASGPAVVVRTPRTVRDLMAVLSRSRRGPAEQSLDTGRASVRELLRTVAGPGSAVDAVCYALLAAAARRRANHTTLRWERDLSTRREH